MLGWQWHQLDHMQIICTSLQASTAPMMLNTKVKLGSQQTSKPNNCKNNLKELIKPAVT